MLITKENFPTILQKLQAPNKYAIDTETTGLSPHHGDRLFSIAVYDGEEAYYFNFQNYGVDDDTTLPKSFLREFQKPFDNEDSTWIMHNAKFDMGMFHAEGLTIRGHVWDTEVGARLEDNSHMRYSLAECGKRIGDEKLDTVMAYIQEHNLYRTVPMKGKNEMQKLLRFDEVPLEIVAPYAEQDVRLTYKLYEKQVMHFAREKEYSPHSNSLPVMAQEQRLTKVCFEMENLGVRIDIPYCNEALKYEKAKLKECEAEYKSITGVKLVDSAKELTKAFAPFGIEPAKTEKEKASFDDNHLATIDHPLARCVRKYREHSKRYEYFNTFLWHSDEAGVLHPNMRQSGTATGRFSYSTPNLQNCPKKEDSPFPVRRAIIPREGFFLSFLDYDQMEYRLMLDYAGARSLINKVKSGLDVHQATADEAHLTRDQAKTTNFAILYGSGIAKLAKNLGIPFEEAKRVKYAVLNSAPEIGFFIGKVINAVKMREDKSIRNWLGRRYYYPDTRWAYKGPNHLIQGGCADIMKKAMVEIYDYLSDKKSKMILQVHDELMIETAYGEEYVLDEIKRIMENAYPHKLLKLTCGVEYGVKSWFDKSETPPWQDNQKQSSTTELNPS